MNDQGRAIFWGVVCSTEERVTALTCLESRRCSPGDSRSFPTTRLHIPLLVFPSLLLCGEVAIVANYLTRLGMLTTISDRVRLVRKRFGTFEVIDFMAVLIGYVLSGEPTLTHYYECLRPFAAPFMALFGRSHLPHRSTLSRFLAALDRPCVEPAPRPELEVPTHSDASDLVCRGANCICASVWSVTCRTVLRTATVSAGGNTLSAGTAPRT